MNWASKSKGLGEMDSAVPLRGSPKKDLAKSEVTVIGQPEFHCFPGSQWLVKYPPKKKGRATHAEISTHYVRKGREGIGSNEERGNKKYPCARRCAENLWVLRDLLTPPLIGGGLAESACLPGKGGHEHLALVDELRWMCGICGNVGAEKLCRIRVAAWEDAVRIEMRPESCKVKESTYLMSKEMNSLNPFPAASAAE
jgi:hypothetical protein